MIIPHSKARILNSIFIVGIALELFFVVTLGDVAEGRGDFGDLMSPKDDKKSVTMFSPTPTLTPTPTPAFGMPVKMEIPAIGVNAGVEQLGIEPNGQMQAPKNFANVGWYVSSSRPGWRGNAVFSGHYDTTSGTPAVLFYLNRLPIGSEIILTDEVGRRLTYKVVNSMSKPVGDWDSQEIFGQSEKESLRLITCSGWWNPTTRNYSHRYIVFADLVND